VSLLTREADAIAWLSARDLPVPHVPLRLPQYIVLSDVGAPLDTQLRDPATRPDRLPGVPMICDY